MEAIHSQKLVYVHERTASHFHASKAKNLAHRFGTGDILFNLDGDNWADRIFETCQDAFGQGERILHLFDEFGDGTYGRIGMPKEWFYRVGGYDESFEPMAYQDIDLIERARRIGLPYDRRTGWPATVANTLEDKIVNTGSKHSWFDMLDVNRNKSKSNIAEGRFVVNPTGWGVAEVSVNFGPFLAVDPIVPGVQ